MNGLRASEMSRMLVTRLKLSFDPQQKPELTCHAFCVSTSGLERIWEYDSPVNMVYFI